MPIALALPAVWKMVLYAVVAVLGMVGAWYLNKMIVKWWNEYQDAANAKKATDARAETQSDDQKANADSDALKKLDGR